MPINVLAKKVWFKTLATPKSPTLTQYYRNKVTIKKKKNKEKKLKKSLINGYMVW